MECMTIGYAASTSSNTSDTVSNSTGKRSVRCVRLLRPKVVGTISRNPSTGRSAPGFGFSLRGGHEHGVGFFIAKVESGSEAARQGLQVGDQIMRINGHRVSDAVHSELLHFIANQTRLKLKVRNVGMIPKKDHMHDPLTWHIVSEIPPMYTPEKGMNSALGRRNSSDLKEMVVNILVPPKAKLGCGLCKGPEWRPGIFIQFTKENGIARKAGLRPGDQIIKCNGIDFRDIQFADAVLVMKKSNRLVLTLLPGVGNDLFSAESSGYNSSASSATGGENSPSSSDCKRLSIVTEEVSDLGDKIHQFGLSNRFRKHSFDNLDMHWKKTNSFESDTDTEISNGYHSGAKRINHAMKAHTMHPRMRQNSTIINLSENGTTIQSCYDDSIIYPVMKPARSHSNISQIDVSEKKTVIVDVHQPHDSNNKISDTSENFNVPSESSYSSYASHNGTSLSNAISEELKRRAERSKDVNHSMATPDLKRKPKTSLCNLDNKKMEQHNALMDEFKKAHRKMFARENGGNQAENKTEKMNGSTEKERQPLNLKPDAAPRNEVSQQRDVVKMDTARKPSKCPPPPPPLPPLSPITATKDITTNGKDETDRPPSTPTPDYDTSTLEKRKSTILTNGIGTYKAKSATPTSPKPPPMFADQNGTMKKSIRPVSITIGEYPSNTTRKEPSKLEFLTDSKNGKTFTDSEPIGSRLQSELTKTLSRSNLKKKTDALDLKLSQKMDNLIMDNKNFHMRYPETGVVLAPPSISIPKITTKSINGTTKINIFNANKEALEGSLANLRKLREFQMNKDKEATAPKALPTFHQVTMVIKDSNTSTGN